MDLKKQALVVFIMLNMIGCTGLSQDTNPPTGNIVGTALGAGAGAGTVAVLGAKSPLLIGAAGIAGASLGYYLTTLRFASGGVIAAGGHVYTLGDTVIIEVPTDHLFDANSSDFLPGTEPLLRSMASILARYSDHDIFISGNTSGSWTHRFEQKMSECRASQVAAALWAQGVTNGNGANDKETRIESDQHQRRLIYVGYGDEFPIANNIRLKGIRANSRIQIVATLPYHELHWNESKHRFKRFDNIANVATSDANTLPPSEDYSQYAYAFSDNHTPTVRTLEPNYTSRVGTPVPATENTAHIQEIVGEPDDISRYNTVTGKAERENRPESYNKAANASQTTEGASVVKQRGYKEDDFKEEGALGGNSPT